MYRYFKSFQILRALAFIAIFFYHVTVIDEVFSRWGITVFLMLSGFLNAVHGYDKEMPSDIGYSITYATRKIKKLYLLHLVMLVVAFLLWTFSNRTLIFSNIKEQILLNILKLTTNVLLISDWGPKTGWWLNIFSEYNIVTWYLSLSFLLFILTPSALRIMHKVYDSDGKYSKKDLLKSILVSAVIYVITILINWALVIFYGRDDAFVLTYESPLSRAGDYLIALQGGYIYTKINNKIVADTDSKITNIMMYKWGCIATSSVLLSILLMFIGVCSLGSEDKWIVSTGFYFTIPTIVLVCSLAMLEEGVDKTIANKGGIGSIGGGMVLLGTLSQYAFLIHVPAINVTHAVYGRLAEVNTYLWVLIAFVVTVMLSILYTKARNLRQS